MKLIRPSLAFILTICILSQVACGGGFAQQLRVVLALAPPLVDSLVASGIIPASARATFITDFSDLAAGAASLKENLDACTDNQCKVGAVDIYQQVFFDVQRRGHLGRVEKLHKVELILAGIIASARIYYGGSNPALEATSTSVVTEDSIKQQIRALKAEMQP